VESLLNLLEETAMAWGVRMRRYDESLTGLVNYDEGLRTRLFPGYDFASLAESLRGIEQDTVYLSEDSYGCHYFLFVPPPPR
jgi:hypothetical protein